MYSLFNNYTVSPIVSPTVSPTAMASVSNVVYTDMSDVIFSVNKTSLIVSSMIFLVYLLVRSELSKHMDVLRDINKNNNDNFEILRDILQENNCDICAVRDDVRSLRRNLNRSSKTKMENAAEALVEMKND